MWQILFVVLYYYFCISMNYEIYTSTKEFISILFCTNKKFHEPKRKNLRTLYMWVIGTMKRGTPCASLKFSTLYAVWLYLSLLKLAKTRSKLWEIGIVNSFFMTKHWKFLDAHVLQVVDILRTPPAMVNLSKSWRKWTHNIIPLDIESYNDRTKYRHLTYNNLNTNYNKKMRWVYVICNAHDLFE